MSGLSSRPSLGCWSSPQSWANVNMSFDMPLLLPSSMSVSGVCANGDSGKTRGRDFNQLEVQTDTWRESMRQACSRKSDVHPTASKRLACLNHREPCWVRILAVFLAVHPWRSHRTLPSLGVIPCKVRMLKKRNSDGIWVDICPRHFCIVRGESHFFSRPQPHTPTPLSTV